MPIGLIILLVRLLVRVASIPLHRRQEAKRREEAECHAAADILREMGVVEDWALSIMIAREARRERGELVRYVHQTDFMRGQAARWALDEARRQAQKGEQHEREG